METVRHFIFGGSKISADGDYSHEIKRCLLLGRKALSNLDSLLKTRARYWMLGAGALGRPRGMEWGGRKEEGSGWGTHVYLWRIHFDIWQN